MTQTKHATLSALGTMKEPVAAHTSRTLVGRDTELDQTVTCSASGSGSTAPASYCSAVTPVSARPVC